MQTSQSATRSMNKNILTSILFSLTGFFLYTPVAKAVDFVPLTGFFNGVAGNGYDTTEFIQLLYGMAISVAALLAVIRIVYAGVQYMLTDVITSKQKAKKDITGAILGLMIVIGAVFILRLINPDLVVFNLFNDANVELNINEAELPDITNP